MNTRLNFLYFINNIHYSLSPGHGFWFFFRQKERPPLLRSRFLVLFQTIQTNVQTKTKTTSQRRDCSVSRIHLCTNHPSIRRRCASFCIHCCLRRHSVSRVADPTEGTEYHPSRRREATPITPSTSMQHHRERKDRCRCPLQWDGVPLGLV